MRGQPATPTGHLQARAVHRPLPRPPGHQGVHRGHVRGGQRTRRSTPADQRRAQRPGAQALRAPQRAPRPRGRRARPRRRPPPGPWRAAPRRAARGPRGRRAAGRRSGPAPTSRPVPAPPPWRAAAGGAPPRDALPRRPGGWSGRATPRGPALRRLGRAPRGAGPAQDDAARPAPRACRPANGARATRQRQEHLLGLVVARVGEQHRDRAELARRLSQCLVPDLTGVGLAGPGRRDRPDLDRLEPQSAALLRCPLGHLPAARLEPVVHHDGTRAHPGTRRDERGRSGQGERVGPARARHQHQRLRAGEGTGPTGELGRSSRTASPHGGDRGIGPGHGRVRRNHTAGSAISAALGNASGAVQATSSASCAVRLTSRTNVGPPGTGELASIPSSRRSTFWVPAGNAAPPSAHAAAAATG